MTSWGERLWVRLGGSLDGQRWDDDWCTVVVSERSMGEVAAALRDVGADHRIEVTDLHGRPDLVEVHVREAHRALAEEVHRRVEEEAARSGDPAEVWGYWLLGTAASAGDAQRLARALADAGIASGSTPIGAGHRVEVSVHRDHLPAAVAILRSLDPAFVRVELDPDAAAARARRGGRRSR